jgi:hypothetical protein
VSVGITLFGFASVDGFPQTSPLQGWGLHLAKGLWIVGYIIFPGQSTAAVAMSGMRVAADLRVSLKYGTIQQVQQKSVLI